MKYSNTVIYADESGDHSLTSVDTHYPLFVLGFCLFEKQVSAEQVSPAVLRFKHEWFGHEAVVLHAHEVRKAAGVFRILFDPAVRSRFMAGVNGLMDAAPFTLLAAVIQKQKLVQQYKNPENPYSLALGFLLERAYNHLQTINDADGITWVVVESRGKKEDTELEAAFRRICDGSNHHNQRLPFDIQFADKKANLAGLQIADFVCQPIGRHVMDAAQPNRAYEILQRKFRRSSTGVITGWGLKCFP